MLRMEISVPKTKVMVVSTGVLPPHSFTCNGHDIEQVTAFSYLGLQVYSTGSVAYSISPLRAKPASSWGVVQQRHAQLQCGDTVHFKLKLLQSIPISAINHGCEVWGMHSPAVAAANQARIWPAKGV